MTPIEKRIRKRLQPKMRRENPPRAVPVARWLGISQQLARYYLSKIAREDARREELSQ